MKQYQIFDEMLDAVFIFDEDKKIIYLNNMAAVLFQLSPNRVIGKKTFEHFIFSNEDLLCMPDGSLGHDIATQYFEVDFTSPKGVIGTVRVMIQPDLLCESEARWIAYMHDVTEEKMLSGKYQNVFEEKTSAEKTISQIQGDLKTVTDLALKDEMTGLANFRAFNKRLQEEILISIKKNQPFGIAMLDVDKFKIFNDTYGHQQGDEVLRKVAQTYEKNVRATDFVARYGGEEFVIILPNTDENGVKVVCEKVRIAVQETQVPYLAKTGEFLKVTASFGGLCIYPEDLLTTGVTDQKVFIESADKNLYKAKESGRNRVVASKWNPDGDN